MKKHILAAALVLGVMFFVGHSVSADSGICEATGGAHCYYVAPNGSDSNPGTFAAPFKTFYPAVKAVLPGDFIYARGGTYTAANNMIYSYMDHVDKTAMVALSTYYNSAIPQYTVQNGTPGHPITLKAYPGEHPVFNGSVTSDSSTWGVNSIALLTNNLSPTGQQYWIIDGFEIVDGTISMNGGRGFGKETHDITIQNNYIHDYITYPGAANNLGLVRIDRGDTSGAYNILIQGNHFKSISAPTSPGVWHGASPQAAGITTLSVQVYSDVSHGGTGKISILNNEFEQMAAAFYFKNPMLGPIEVSGNTIHDVDELAGVTATSNLNFHNNLVYNSTGGFANVGPAESSDPAVNAISGQNEIIQNNTFVGMNGIMNINQGVGHTVTNNIVAGITSSVAHAGWDTGGGFITKSQYAPDPTPPSYATSILQRFGTSDNNCLIVSNADFIGVSRYWDDGTPLEFNTFAQAQSRYGIDPHSIVIVQPDLTKFFVSPSSNNYTLIDPTQCPGMGAGTVTPPSLPSGPIIPPPSSPSTPTTPSSGPAPQIVSSGPSGTYPSNTTGAILSVTTNENATCKYSTTANQSFSSMSAFASTGGILHSSTLSTLSPQTYNYYIKCADPTGNTSTTDYPITFTISGTPSASTDTTTNTTVVPPPADPLAAVIALILDNRPLFQKATSLGITLPPLIQKVLDSGTLTQADLDGTSAVQFTAPPTTATQTTTAVTSTPTSHTSLSLSSITRPLKLNYIGTDVILLQNFLIQTNAGPQARSLASHGANGSFGPLTQSALMEYQKSIGVTQTGILDTNTRR